jgi:hypothetical protein
MIGSEVHTQALKIGVRKVKNLVKLAPNGQLKLMMGGGGGDGRQTFTTKYVR